MVDKITTCLDRYKEVYEQTPPSKKLVGQELTCGEAFTLDDYNTVGFQGYNNKNRPKEEITKWAEDTKKLARNSIIAHLFEVPLKLFSHFYKPHEGEEHDLKCKIVFFLERFVDSLGGRFRNQIYAHKDSNKNLDDNLGAENFAKEKFGDNTSYNIALANNHFQTTGRFLVPVLGFISPTLANDLDWFIGGTLDAIRWKRAASNSAFYPGFFQDFFNGLTFRENVDLKKVCGFAFNQFKNHCLSAKQSWNEYFNSKGMKHEKKNEALVSFHKNMDQITSIFLALSQWPNMIGDVLRPIARRLEWTGVSRNLIRTLSVIDRPFIWLNYLFRFYFPERITENNETQTNKLKNSHLMPLAMLGDAVNFTSTLFEDRVKEGPFWLKHSLKLAEILKNSLFKIFFSARRNRIANQTLAEENQILNLS